MYTRAGDISNAFHHMSLPEGLRGYLLLPSINASYLPASVRDGLSGRVTPRLTVLPMGWAWSLYFYQSLLDSAVRQAGLLNAGRIHDRSGELFLPDRVATSDQEVNSIQYAHVSYVDNFGVVGVDEHEVNDVALRIAEVLRSWGLGVSPSTISKLHVLFQSSWD